jgi:hypothetical protein
LVRFPRPIPYLNPSAVSDNYADNVDRKCVADLAEIVDPIGRRPVPERRMRKLTPKAVVRYNTLLRCERVEC